MIREYVRHFFRHAPILAIAAGVSQLLGLLSIAVLMRYNVGDAEAGAVRYGVYTFILAVLSMIGVASLTGMPSAILVGVAQGRPDALRSLTRRRIASAARVGCPILAVAGLAMAFFIPKLASPGYACLILAPIFPFIYSFTGVISYFNALHRFTGLALFQVVSGLLNLAVVVIILRFWPDRYVLPPVAWLVSKTLFEAGIYLWLVRRDRIPWRPAEAHLVSYGKKITLTGVTGNIESHLDSFIIGTLFEFVDLGFYRAGRAIVMPLRQVAQIYSQLMTPSLARQTPAQALSATNRLMAWSAPLILPGAALIYLALPWIYRLFLAEAGETAVVYARWFLLMVLVGTPWYFYYPFFRSQRQARRELIVFWSRGASLTVLMLLLIPFFGIMGIVYAEILATVVTSALAGAEARRSVPVRPSGNVPPVHRRRPANAK